MDERTGELHDSILTIDNYGGLSETDRPIIGHTSSGNWYFETTAVVSSWGSSALYVEQSGWAAGVAG